MAEWAPRREPCPACGTVMENDPRYAFWCEACNWNLMRGTDATKAGPVLRFARRLGRWQGRGLVRDVIRRRAPRPRLDLTTAVATGIAGLVLVWFVVLVVLGGVLLLASGGFVIGWLIGLLLLGLAWVMRPRLPRLNERVHGRSELPRLFRLVDLVGEAAGGARVDGIVIWFATNAAYARSGWRRRRILFIGLPLFSALDPGPRVALIGHELGHGVNGDPGRTLLVHSSVSALVEAYLVLEPDSILPDVREGLLGYLTVPFRIVQLAVARSILGVALLQLALLYRQSQRAEFHADAIAARLAGSDATLALLDRWFAAEAAQAVTWTDRSGDPVAGIAARLRSTPDREIERMRRVEAIQGPRLDASHPPTGARETVIRSLPREPGTVFLTHGESDAIDRELERFRAEIGAEIRDRSIAALS